MVITCYMANGIWYAHRVTLWCDRIRHELDSAHHLCSESTFPCWKASSGIKPNQTDFNNMNRDTLLSQKPSKTHTHTHPHTTDKQFPTARHLSAESVADADLPAMPPAPRRRHRRPRSSRGCRRGPSPSPGGPRLN